MRRLLQVNKQGEGPHLLAEPLRSGSQATTYSTHSHPFPPVRNPAHVSINPRRRSNRWRLARAAAVKLPRLWARACSTTVNWISVHSIHQAVEHGGHDNFHQNRPSARPTVRVGRNYSGRKRHLGAPVATH